MKILFLSEEFPPTNIGGSGVIAYDLAKGLKKRGHDIFVITIVQDKSDESKVDLNGLKVFRIYSNYHVRWRAWLSLYNPKITFKVKKIIKEIKPDIVHAHNIHWHLSYHCLKIAKKNSKLVFLTVHDVMLIHYGKLMPKNGSCFYKIRAFDQLRQEKKRYNPFRNLIIRYYLKYIDKIFSVSNSVKEVLEINSIKNIETIYNGINVAEWEEDLEKIKVFREKHNLQNKKIILFGGRLSKAKGGEVILKAMPLITKKIKDVILLVAGKKDWYIEKMIDLVKKLGIENNIKFIGWLDREEMKCAFFASDVCVTPSIYLDPFPTVNLEAMASKKPVIGTCFGGTPEIVIDNKTGYIVNPYNIEEMAEKIIDLLKNPQKAKKFGEAGYQRIKENFSLENQVKKVLEWYES